VPIAVSAVTAEQLRTAAITGTASLKLAVPSADVPVLNGYAAPFIRGIGSKAAGPATESPVSTYVDNVYIGNSSSALLQFNNIARVEVVKGPQGTLFGRNATGGLISVITRDPTSEVQGVARASYGNYDTAQGDLYIGGPIASGIKADFAAYGSRQGDGWGTNFFTGEDVGRTNYDYGLRTKWLFGDGPLTVRVIADYSAMKTSAFAQRIAFGWTAPPPYGPAYGGSPWDTALTVSPLLKTHGGGLSAKLDYELSPAVTLSSITAWRKNRYHNHFDGDVTPTDGREINAVQLDEQFSQEFQLLSGPASPFTWVAGVFLYDANGRYDPSRLSANGPSRVGPFAAAPVSVTFAKQDVVSIAPYAQATVEIAEGTKLTLGGRFSYERRTQHGEQFNYAPSGSLFSNPTIDQRLIAKKPTWRVAVDHQFGPSVLGYVSYNRGFKSGGANMTAVNAPFYRPEKLDAYETGLKSTLFDRRVRLNGAAFYYDYKNLQVVSSNAGVISIYNGAAARTYGLELELDAQITSQLRVNAGYTWLDGQFTDFPNALINIPNAAGGVRQVFGSAQGNRLPNAPRSVATLNASYTIPIGSDTLTLNGNAYFNSGYFAEPDNFRRQGAYELYNASADFTFRDRWTISVWGRNLSNEAVDLFPSVNGVGGGLGEPRSSYAAPRTYGVTVGVKF
jgi:outer membrane receptor protein involved in Fe transport